MTKGNCLQLFYNDGSKYATFAYSTANGLSYSNQTNTVSSKDHGLHPTTEVQGSNWSFTGTCLFTSATANAALEMAKAAKPYSFCFAEIAETEWQDGLKSVTDIATNTSWSVGSGFVQYGEGIVTDFSITANDGENATCDITITGSGSLNSTAPVTPSSYGD